MNFKEDKFLVNIDTKNPHSVVKNYMIYYFETLYEDCSLLETLHRYFDAFYCDNGPGKGFGEMSPNVTGYYDWEKMDELNRG